MSQSHEQYIDNLFCQSETVDAGFDAAQTNAYHLSGPSGGKCLEQQHKALSELQHGAQPLSRDEFLSRVAATKERIARLASDIQSIANIHQRMLWSPNARFAELEGILEETQKTNTSIKDDIKVLEYDALREPDDRVKKPQVESLKRSFKTQLDAFQKEESDYAQRCRDAIGRQYQIINPEATEAEISEVADADWGDEGIFSQAVKSYDGAQASSVLGAVRARHNDIQRIEQTLGELALVFQHLDKQVVHQEPQVARVEEQTDHVNQATRQANDQLIKGIGSARRARKLKWWMLGVVVSVLITLALVFGIYYGHIATDRKKDIRE